MAIADDINEIICIEIISLFYTFTSSKYFNDILSQHLLFIRVSPILAMVHRAIFALFRYTKWYVRRKV